MVRPHHREHAPGRHGAPRPRLRCFDRAQSPPCDAVDLQYGTNRPARGPTRVRFSALGACRIVRDDRLSQWAAELLYGPYIDYIASVLGASAALAAVIRSRSSGKGALIDLSQYECGLMFMGAALADFFATGQAAERCGNDDPVAAPHGAYPCADGEWVALSCWSHAD